MKITIEIPDEKVRRVEEAMASIYPIPYKELFVENPEKEFIDNDWIKEQLRLFIIKTVQKHEDIIAKKQVEVNMDDSLVVME